MTKYNQKYFCTISLCICLFMGHFFKAKKHFVNQQFQSSSVKYILTLIISIKFIMLIFLCVSFTLFSLCRDVKIKYWFETWREIML